MGQSRVEGFISDLEGRFEAAIGAEEDAAARDLAFSLAQDVPATHEILKSGGRVRLPQVEAVIDSVGRDFLRAGSWLVPLDRAIVAFVAEKTPAREADVLLAQLRRWARAGAWVEVGCGQAIPMAGYLRVAGMTELVVEAAGRVRIPLSRVDYVRRVLGGSEDAP